MPQTFYTEQEYDNLDLRLTELNSRLEVLEELRPHWAKGYTSDGVTAQVHLNALVSLWKMLGAENQTDAVIKLKFLLEKVP